MKSTSMNVTAILVRTGLRVSMELTSTLVNACLDSPEFIAKQTSTNALHLLAQTTESASISLTASSVSVFEAITMRGV